jgi:hypothetical protein
LSSASIEKYPDDIWEADNKHYLEPLEFHSGIEIFYGRASAYRWAVIGFYTFPSPISSRPIAVHRAHLASFPSSQWSSSTSGRCWPRSTAACAAPLIDILDAEGFVMRHLRAVCEKVVYIDSPAMKRRSKSTLGPRPAVSPKPSKVRPAPPKRESPKIQARAAALPPSLSPPAADAVEKEEFLRTNRSRPSCHVRSMNLSPWRLSRSGSCSSISSLASSKNSWSAPRPID